MGAGVVAGVDVDAAVGAGVVPELAVGEAVGALNTANAAVPVLEPAPS